jgi:hypothetical protein
MYLVKVHHHVNDTADVLLHRTMRALVDDIAEEALRSFKQVEKFGVGGMLRVCVSTLLFTLHLHWCTHVGLYCYTITGNARDRVFPSNPHAICH